MAVMTGEPLAHFGQPQRACEVCGKALKEFRVLKIRISAKSGEVLARLRYEVPLCKEHRGDDSKAVNVEVSWDKELCKDGDL